MRRKTYYHVIEEGHYNEVASHGCYDTIEEARNESNRLHSLFNELSFWIYESDTEDEPVICTI